MARGKRGDAVGIPEHETTTTTTTAATTTATTAKANVSSAGAREGAENSDGDDDNASTDNEQGDTESLLALGDRDLDQPEHSHRHRHRAPRLSVAVQPDRDISLADSDFEGLLVEDEEDRTPDPFLDEDMFPRLVIWGELEPNLPNEVRSVYNRVLTPYLHFTDWMQCSADHLEQLKTAIDRLTTSLDLPAAALSMRNITLRVPTVYALGNVRPNNTRSVSSEMLAEAEGFVEDWMEAIEDVVHEAAFERPPHFRGVAGELAFWKDRQVTLSSITDQLKTRARQSILSVLISNQSKAVRRWRSMDGAITEATNECKDYIKFLENIRPLLNDLAKPDPRACTERKRESVCECE